MFQHNHCEYFIDASMSNFWTCFFFFDGFHKYLTNYFGDNFLPVFWTGQWAHQACTWVFEHFSQGHSPLQRWFCDPPQCLVWGIQELQRTCWRGCPEEWWLQDDTKSEAKLQLVFDHLELCFPFLVKWTYQFKMIYLCWMILYHLNSYLYISSASKAKGDMSGSKILQKMLDSSLSFSLG